MDLVRIVAVAVGAGAVLYFSLDSGMASRETPPPGTSLALGILGSVFGVSATVLHLGKQPGRVPLLVGLSIATLGYAILRAVAF